MKRIEDAMKVVGPNVRSSRITFDDEREREQLLEIVAYWMEQVYHAGYENACRNFEGLAKKMKDTKEGRGHRVVP